MLWWLELMGLLLEILDTDIVSPLTERLVPDYFLDAVPHDAGGHSCIAADSPCSGHARCQTPCSFCSFRVCTFHSTSLPIPHRGWDGKKAAGQDLPTADQQMVPSRWPLRSKTGTHADGPDTGNLSVQSALSKPCLLHIAAFPFPAV